jgi:polyisoprenoid-binding protein YceI
MTTRTPALIGLALGALAISSAAAAPTASAPTWTVDHAASTLGFAGVAQDTAFTGTFGKWDAAILFDPANLGASQATVTVDPASAKTGDPNKDGPLQEDAWFATATHPQATFKTSTIRSTGANAYVADGTLTIRGISQPASLPFTLTIDGNNAHMTGSMKLDRSSFQLGAGAWQDHSVEPEVTVNVDLTAHKAG